MTRKSRFIGNTTALAVSAVLTAVLTLIQVKILAAFLSRESFGLFAALRGLSLFVAMVAANGLPHVLVRFLPEHETRAELRRALTLSMWTLGVASVALVAVCFGVMRFEDWLFRSVPALQRTNALQVWFLLTIIGISLKVVLYAGLNGLRRLGSQTVIEVSALVVQVLWMYLVRDSLSLEVLFRIIAIVTIGTVAITLPWYFVRL
ncbi:MAG: oligosaccharide flippase family protein, partial [Candidatus Krumholzibacteriota bacterium]|nr:oligosaccharide flippase family protein [Candidatus Krumholzibacteriota bacterium]